MTESNQKDQNVNEFNRFLENNAQFLVEKYDEYFKKTSVAIKQFNKQAGIKYIYDVFSFSKYEQDEKMNTTLQKSLSKNIQDFLNGLAKKKQQFNNKTAVQMLKFCIENNQMFAVKYDKKDKKLKTQQQMGESAIQQKQQENQQQQQNQQEHKQNQGVQNNNQKQQKEQQEQEQDSNAKQNEQQIKNQSRDLSNLINQFDHLQSPIHKVVDPQVIKKNLKIMFEFFCKQQQNIGVHATFDRINRQCNTMTLGKFIAFCNQTGVLNDKLDKSLLMRKFKQVAQGRKQIQFDQFYQLAQMLSTIDESLIPKLGVSEKSGFKSKLKQRLFPFSTREAALRDVHESKHQIFVPKLTSHSGKLQDELQIQLKKRKQQKAQAARSLNKSKITSTQNSTQSEQPNQYSENGKRYDTSRVRQASQVMIPTKLVNGQLQDFQHDFSFLQKFVNAEEADQQWLKQYKIPYKKVPSIVHPRLMNRKESIVSNLKKRVEELEKRQTGKTNQMQKRQYMSHNRNRERVSKSILN